MEGTNRLRNKILVVGHPSAEKDNFISKLGISNPFAFEAENSQKFAGHHWTINNKYYSAEVQFVLVDVDISTPLDDLHLLFGPISEALILVVSSKESTELFTRWETFIEEHAPSILLCISNQHDESVSSWCIDNGVEFVALDAQPQEDEDDGRFQEKLGVERVLEALEANMWPNMVSKTVERPQQLPVDMDDLADSLNQTEESVKKISLEDKQKEEEKDAKSAFHSKSASLAAEAARLTTEDLIFKEDDITDPFGLGENELDDEMKELEFFDRTLGQLAGLRTRSQNMSDEDRRKMAAQVTLSFLRSLDFDGDE